MSTTPKMITGTALTIGTSRNSNRYDAGLIQRAVARAQEKVKAGRLLMLASHGDGDRDDLTRAAGVVRELYVDRDGSAKFRAELIDSTAGRDVAAVLDRSGGEVDVSIRGAWVGPLETEKGPHGPVTFAQDLDLLSVDFTLAGGVRGAVARAAEAGPRDPRIVQESVSVDPAPEPPELSARELAVMTPEESRSHRMAWMARQEAAVRAANRARPSIASIIADQSGVTG